VATIQVILQGARIGTYEILDYPLVLQFGDQKSYGQAVWFIPTCSGRIEASMVSEIRVQEGSLTVLVDGPEGFRSGPHPADWIRGYYPRGKDCALIKVDSESRKVSGITFTTVAGNLLVEELSLGGPTPAGSSPEILATISVR
jgi:hypothetical protein